MFGVSCRSTGDCEFDRLIAAVLRSGCTQDEFNLDRLPELTPEECAALDSLGEDFVRRQVDQDRLVDQDWIWRFRQAVQDGARGVMLDLFSELLRWYGGTANALVNQLAPELDFAGVADRALKSVHANAQDYDPTKQSLRDWFLQIVNEQILSLQQAAEVQVSYTQAFLVQSR